MHLSLPSGRSMLVLVAAAGATAAIAAAPVWSAAQTPTHVSGQARSAGSTSSRSTSNSDRAVRTTTTTPGIGPAADLSDPAVKAWIDADKKQAACERGRGYQVSDPDATGLYTYSYHLNYTKAEPRQEAAFRACYAHPKNASIPDQLDPARTQWPYDRAAFGRYSACMHEHGATDFPSADSFQPGSLDWTWYTATAEHAEKTCTTIVYPHGA